METPQPSRFNAASFFLGIVFGAGLTLLFVTKKGRKILKMLHTQSDEWLKTLEEIWSENHEVVVERAQDKIGQLAERVEEAKGQFGEMEKGLRKSKKVKKVVSKAKKFFRTKKQA